MKKFILKNWPLLTILVLSFLITWPLFLPGYFSHHDDLQVMRIFEMRRCFSDFQIPCRWVPDMGYGNGFPLFNYYGPFPYYIGAFFSFLVGYIWVAKILFFLSLVLGGISMYFLAKELFGKHAGIVSGILYLFAPYRALDSYVRGAVSESFALAIIPLLFYFILRFSKKKTLNNFLWTMVLTGSFLITHNIMTLLFMPVVILFTIYHVLFENRKNYFAVALGILLGVGLASFFIFPAYLEKSLVQTDSLTRFDLDFRVHFATVSQLFLKRDWGYGPSILGPGDKLSFQIGWPHWWLVGVAFILVIINMLKEQKMVWKNFIFVVLLFAIFVFSVFMTHNKSGFIWEKIGILRFVQFPWRFLSLSIFSASLLGGFVITALQGKLQKIIIVLVVITTVGLNWSFFRPEHFFYSLTDNEKLSGELWETQQKAAILDYLPKTAYEPRELAPKEPVIVSGQANISGFVNKSNSFGFKTEVKTAANIEVPVFDFPLWQVKINGREYQHSHNNFLGRIRLDLETGNYKVEGYFQNTPLRTVSNLISLTSFLIILVFIFYGKSKKFF